MKEVTRYVHVDGSATKGKIMFVVSSPAVSEQTGWDIGFWAAELTHPFRVFEEAGYEVEIVSTTGGQVMMDAYSDPTDTSGYSKDDVITLGYMQQPSFLERLQNTKSIADVVAEEYDAIFLVGGQGPMYTYRGNERLEQLFASFVDSGKPSAAVCHATTLLLGAKLQDGSLIVAGKTWTGFANSEEDYSDAAAGVQVQPYRIQEEAKKIENTTFVVSEPLMSHVIVDGNLVTGQQQNSGAEAANQVIVLLENK